MYETLPFLFSSTFGDFFGFTSKQTSSDFRSAGLSSSRPEEALPARGAPVLSSSSLHVLTRTVAPNTRVPYHICIIAHRKEPEAPRGHESRLAQRLMTAFSNVLQKNNTGGKGVSPSAVTS